MHFARCRRDSPRRSTSEVGVADGRTLARLLPPIDAVGADLLTLTRGQRVAELVSPFLTLVGFGVFAVAGLWTGAIVCLALFFPRFGVAFHDLLHGSLSLRSRVSGLLLTVLGLTVLYSGHAARAAHLEHHRRFPAADDPE